MIPLLSPKPFKDFSPIEFLFYVKSLQIKPERKEKVIKLKKPFVAKLTTKGRLSIRTQRSPKWLSEEEMKQISAEFKIPLNEIFLEMKKKKIKISTLSVETEKKSDASKVTL